LGMHNPHPVHFSSSTIMIFRVLMGRMHLVAQGTVPP
jgi:hypothetical protein